MKKQTFHLLLFLLFATLLMGVGLSVPPAHAQTETALPWTPPTPAYKIMVEQTGLYELSHADLASTGLPLDVLDPRTFQMFNNGEEIAILVQGEADGSFNEGDSILFFGQKADTRYTHVNVYWLTYGAASGLRMGQRPSLEDGDSLPSYPALARYEDNQTYSSTRPRAEGHDHWYGPSIQAARYNNPGQRTFSLPLDAVAGQGEATLEGLFAGNVTGVHHLRLYVNDQLVHEGSWSGRSLYPVSAAVPQTVLHDGENSVRAVLLNDESGQAFDMVYLDWLQLRYARQLTTRNQTLLFDVEQAGRWQYRISGFSQSEVQAFDITDPARVQQIVGVKSGERFTLFLPRVQYGQSSAASASVTDDPPPSGQVVQFGDDISGPRRYLVLSASQRLAPLQILPDAPSDLQHPAQGADYILITHHDFQAQAQHLADYRAGQGMRTVVVDVQDIYDEFNGGLTSAEAIHDFLAYAYEHWPAPAPQYVLLLGDGTYDMRHYLPDTAPTYIPPYLAFIDTLLGEAASDNRFVTLSGDDNMPEMNIGRTHARQHLGRGRNHDLQNHRLRDATRARRLEPQCPFRHR